MAASTPAAGKRRLLRREARAASILLAAARTFARGGYAATSMDDIASEAGVSKLMLYRHFNSKHELYEAVLEEVRTRLMAIAHRPATLQGVAADQAVPEATATLLATIRVAREFPEAYRLLYEHAAHEPEFAGLAADIRARSIAKAEELLGPLVEDPVVRRWAARLVAAVSQEGVLAWLDAGDPERDEYAAERLTLMLGSMLGPLAGPG
jgi:AcrR family transcriptional regulator